MEVEEKESASKAFGLERLYKDHADYSWVNQLDKDPDTEKYGVLSWLHLLTLQLPTNPAGKL